MLTDNVSFEFFSWLLQYDRLEDIYIKIVNTYAQNESVDNNTSADAVFEHLFNAEIERNSVLIDKEISMLYLQSENRVEAMRKCYDRISRFLSLSRVLYPEWPYLHERLEANLSYIRDISGKSDANYYSIKWITARDKLDILYDKLTEVPTLIACDKADFITAFTGGEVERGIKWLAKGKNKKINKSLLFYLLEKLDDTGLIAEVDNSDISKVIETVFLSEEGNKLMNLRQSKSQRSVNPMGRERIDKIIEDVIALQ